MSRHRRLAGYYRHDQVLFLEEVLEAPDEESRTSILRIDPDFIRIRERARQMIEAIRQDLRMIPEDVALPFPSQLDRAPEMGADE